MCISGDFLAVQITYTLGSVLLFIGTLGIYAYMAVQKFRTCKKIAIANTLNIGLAGKYQYSFPYRQIWLSRASRQSLVSLVSSPAI
jgi:uncharacterized membrane protein